MTTNSGALAPAVTSTVSTPLNQAGYIGTLDRPTTGRIEIDGEVPHDLAERELAAFRNRRVGFVFQDHHLLPQYTVLENVLVPAMAPSSDADSEEVVDRARELIDRVGLGERLHHRPAELSGGGLFPRVRHHGRVRGTDA